MRPCFSRPLIGLLVLWLCSCGGSDGSLSGSYRVNDVNILANDIEIGESVRVEVFFETKTEFDGSPDGIDVVVRISPSLRFIPGSARIYDDTTDETDSRDPDGIVECPDGATFLIFNFEDDDLEDRSIAGAADFGLRFEAEGIRRNTGAVVSAAAAENQEFSCSDFASEEQEVVEVL